MRSVTLSVVLLAALAGPAAAAADDDADPPTWTLQVDPLTTALGFVHLQVERALAPHLSVYLGPSLRLYEGIGDGGDFTGLGAEAGVRAFLRPTAPAGWWGQVRGVAAHLSSPGGDTAIGGYASVVAGYTAILGGWFVLAGGVGVQYLAYEVAGRGTKGVLPAAHTTIGAAF